MQGSVLRAAHSDDSKVHHHNSPMNLPVFVEVLQPLQDLLQDAGDAGLIQHAALVLATRDDVLYDVQH